MTNLYPQTFPALLAIPQAFPQHANPAQLASPKVLTSQNYRDSCTHSAACRIRTSLSKPAASARTRQKSVPHFSRFCEKWDSPNATPMGGLTFKAIRVRAHAANSPHVTFHSSITPPPSAIISNRVQLLRNANISLPVGPLRCFEIMISALPFNSSSSCR
jgi:hypothetical protein